MSADTRHASGPLTLAELVDLEARLLDDRDRDPAEIADRDARIAAELGPRAAALPRHELVRRWLAAMATPGAPSIGQRISTVYRIAGVALPVVTFVAGVGTAAGLLAYDGRDPVNIMAYLAVLVFLQGLLIALTVLGMLPRAWLGGVLRVIGLDRGAGVPGLLRELAHRSARTLADRGVIRARGRAALGNLAAWQTIYAGAERWLLTAITQRAAVAFDLGALSATVYLVTVRALAFAWSTTLEIDPALMTRFFRVMATPWRWLETAVPSRELVAASRYFPGRDYDADLLGDWWPFLVAALVAYGLLPRLVLMAYAAYRARAARAALALDHGDCALLVERLAATGEPLGPRRHGRHGRRAGGGGDRRRRWCPSRDRDGGPRTSLGRCRHVAGGSRTARGQHPRLAGRLVRRHSRQRRSRRARASRAPRRQRPARPRRGGSLRAAFEERPAPVAKRAAKRRGPCAGGGRALRRPR